MRSKYVLITRPAGEAPTTANEIGKLGYRALVSPMLDIVPLPFFLENNHPYQAFAFTSANAVRIFSQQYEDRSTPVYTVGQQTKKAAQEAGFNVAGSANGNGRDLAGLLGRTGQEQLLHISGTHVAAPLPNADYLPVYRAVAATGFNPEAAAQLRAGGVGAVMFYSRRTAWRFIELAEKENFLPLFKSIKALCISSEVLECVRPAAWEQTYVAERPDRKGMMALLRSAGL